MRERREESRGGCRKVLAYYYCPDTSERGSTGVKREREREETLKREGRGWKAGGRRGNEGGGGGGGRELVQANRWRSALFSRYVHVLHVATAGPPRADSWVGG